jgi:hypothetical protein
MALVNTQNASCFVHFLLTFSCVFQPMSGEHRINLETKKIVKSNQRLIAKTLENSYNDQISQQEQ